MHDGMSNARARPKSMIRMIYKSHFGGLAAGSEREHRNNVVREQMQDDHIHSLAELSEFARLFQMFCRWRLQHPKKAARILRRLPQHLGNFIHTLEIGLARNGDRVSAARILLYPPPGVPAISPHGSAVTQNMQE